MRGETGEGKAPTYPGAATTTSEMKCKSCRFSALCLSYPYRWDFVHCSGLKLIRCQQCGRVWNGKDAIAGENENGSQLVDLAKLEPIEDPPCGEWHKGETVLHVARCLVCRDWCQWTTATNPATNYGDFAKRT